jgi:light-regulated signal transduction histidine kinase (bacteriophytochrome)
LKELGNALNSCDNRLTEITTYYLNYTSFSYVDIIQQVQNILENYYINEKNKVLNKSQEILDVFEKIANKTLKDEINKIDNLTENLVNKVYTINSASDEEYENLKTNLINSKKYIYDIIKKVKDFIIE